MDYNTLLDLAADLGYELAMSGAETSRVEESVTRVLQSYGVQSEVFAIPNCLTVSIETPEGKPMTRMRRIGYHGNDLDRVERFSALSRSICAQSPSPADARNQLRQVHSDCRHYGMLLYLLGHFLGAAGFCIIFGGCILDALCAGFCGLIVGLINRFMDNLHVNPFFQVITASFTMALAAYSFSVAGFAHNADAVTIGTLMLLVPGLLFTNAMRDIISGDTNSGTNRIVQVLLIAAAIALGTAIAWKTVSFIWFNPVSAPSVDYGLVVSCLGCLAGCLGFAVFYNVHGTGTFLCTLGGGLTWLVYCVCLELGCRDLVAFFFGTVAASIYAESMARIRKCPALIYLVVAIFPLLPGAGIYYTMRYAVEGEMNAFMQKGMHTAAEAGVMAVAILLVSTIFRLWLVRPNKKPQKHNQGT